MKKHIVLATLLTLLASASGCSMFSQMGAQSCETCDPTSPEPLLGRLRLPRISLPWRRTNELSDESAGCNSATEGFSEPTGYAQPTSTFPTSGIIGGEIIQGQIINGPVTEGVIVGETYLGSAPVSDSNLYHPEVVGPVDTSKYRTRYAGELIPAPGSPTVDLAK